MPYNIDDRVSYRGRNGTVTNTATLDGNKFVSIDYDNGLEVLTRAEAVEPPLSSPSNE